MSAKKRKPRDLNRWGDEEVGKRKA